MRTLAVVILMSGTAIASPSDTYDFTTAHDGTVFARHAVPASSSEARARSRTIFLNRHGTTLRPGVNDARVDTSSIVTRQTVLDGWDATAVEWAETVGCMREIWSRFDVIVTDVDPKQTPHIEALFGGSPEDLGLPSNVGGVAPMALDCGIVENSIVFAFPDNLRGDPRSVCEVMSQEIGHSYGLDHELERADPMTYLSYAGDRTFQDRTAACGETAARPCGIAGSVCRPDQNTVQLLLARLGPAGADNSPPTLYVTSPDDGATVEPGFVVVATASDNIGVTVVTLFVDGERSATRSAPPFEFAINDELASGRHVITLEARDANDNATMFELAVRVDPAAGPDASFNPVVGCSTSGSPGLALGLVALLLGRRRRARTSHV